MRIVQCPKGGRVPEGYCKASCLNYPGQDEMGKRLSLKKAKYTFSTKQHA